MTPTRLIVRSLLHYWRTNLAVLLGVIVATAVIGGALVVGDSVRYSLRQMTLKRLGRIDCAVHSHRFFTESLSEKIGSTEEFGYLFDAIAPALRMDGSLQRETADGLLVSSSGVWGLDDRAWRMLEHGGIEPPINREVILSARVARDLSVGVGDEVTMWVEIPSTIPRDSLLGEREETSQEYLLTVREVLSDELGAGRLELNPNQQLPANAFVSLETLQELVDLGRGTRRDRREPRVNTLFVAEDKDFAEKFESVPGGGLHDVLDDILANAITLDDLNLRIDANEQPEYLSLESRQMFVEDVFADAAQEAAEALGLKTSPLLVYLANWIADADSEYVPADDENQPNRHVETVNPIRVAGDVIRDGTKPPTTVPPLVDGHSLNTLVRSDDAPTWFKRYSMYSVIAGVDLDQASPFGPFELIDGSFARSGNDGDNRVYLNRWLGNDLQASVGDTVAVGFHTVGAHGTLPEVVVSLSIGGVVELDGTVASDRGMTPEVDGFTNVETLQDLDLPFLVRKDRLTDRDEDYWMQYRATPKAFVSLDLAQRLWQSRYGKLTSVRVASGNGEPADDVREKFTAEFLSRLKPRDVGMAFDPVKSDGLKAAVGANDFTGLFVGFSFFLIAAAAILIGLLFRLGIERRVRNIGLLAATGFPRQQVRRMFLAEGLIVVAVGGVIGVIAAVAYGALMMHGLRTWWIGAIGTRYLVLHIEPASLIAGFAVGVIVAGGVVWWAMRLYRRISVRALLSGVAQEPDTDDDRVRRGRRSQRIAAICGIAAAGLVAASVVGLVPATEAFSGFSWRVVTFFIVGLLFLTASLTALSAWLRADRATALHGRGLAGLSRLGGRNAARHRQRSVYTVGLMAFATFVIVAVAAGHRNPTAEAPDKNSGNGGYTLVGTSAQPILFDINTAEGREKLDIRVDEGSSDQALLQSTHVMPFAMKPGEDASCLNLYQTRLPTILGVTPQMIERGGFKFADTPGDNPWTLLESSGTHEGQPTYPVLGDLNTLQYSLKKGIGSLIAVPDDENPDYYLEVVGMFDGSVFQGVLLMLEDHFRELYHDQAGYRYFLVETPSEPAEIENASRLYETQLAPFGLDLERVSVRLDSFLAVQNTYLSTFQTLGGFGLLLGTIGLATVMLRNVLERRSEIALLRAVGFRNTGITWLVIWENALLLLWGLASGTISALLAMGPHLLSTGADVPWRGLGMMLATVVGVGSLAALLAVYEAVRTPIVATLRSE